MEERRRYVRLDTRLKIHYRILQVSPTPTSTETLDISGGGIRIFLNEPLKVGTLLELEIFLPNDAKPIRCQGKLVWVEEFSIYQGAKEERKELEGGVEFTHITPEGQDSIIQYVILGYTQQGEGR